MLRLSMTFLVATVLASAAWAQVANAPKDERTVSVEVRLLSISETVLTRDSRLSIRWTKNEGVESATLDAVKMFQLLYEAQGDQRTHLVQFPKTTFREGRPATISAYKPSGSFFEGISLAVDGKAIDVTPAKAEIEPELNPHLRARLLAKPSADGRRVGVQTEIFIGEKKYAWHADVPEGRTAAIVIEKLVDKIQDRAPAPSLWSKVPYVRRFVNSPVAPAPREHVTLFIALVTPRIGEVQREEEVAIVRPFPE